MLFLSVLSMILAQSVRGPSSVIVSTKPPSAEHWAEYRNVTEFGCRRGQQQFCYELAGMLRFGVGGPADKNRANKLLKTSCRQGYKAACNKIEP